MPDGSGGRYGLELRSEFDGGMGSLLSQAVVERLLQVVKGGKGRALSGLKGSRGVSEGTVSESRVSAETWSEGSDEEARVRRRKVTWGKEEITRQETGYSILPYWLLAIVQLLGFMCMGSVLAFPALLVWPAIQYALDHYGVIVGYLLCPLAYHALGLLMAAQTFLLREVLVRGVPGSYPVNSWPFIKWWFMRRLLSMLHALYMNNIQGTSLYIVWLRLCGARIGENVKVIAGAVLPDPDMLIIGGNAIIGKSELVGSIVKDGVLRRGLIEIDAGAKVGTNALMLPGTRLGKNAELRPLSVAQEGQVLPDYGVYEGSPAGFFMPRGTVSHLRAHPRSWSASLFDLTTELISLLAAPTLSILAASMTYPIMSTAAQRAGIFPFLKWVDWQEGRLLLALSTATGIVPFLGLPTLMALMKFKSTALALPAKVLMNFTKAAGYGKLDTKVIQDLFSTDYGVALIKQGLPPGVNVYGEPGKNLHFTSTGRQVLRYVALDGISLPTATSYYIIGVFWIFALGFLLQGCLLTVLTNLLYYLLLGCTAHTSPRRVNGWKWHLRQVKVACLRWTYDKFMRLFAGTDLLPFWYWTLGAKVGKGVVFSNVDVIEDPHLVTLSDGTVLVDHAVLETVGYPGNGYCLSGPITLGKDCIIGVRSVLGPGVSMGDRAVIMPQSSVPADTVIEPDSVMSGAPVHKILDIAGVHTASNPLPRTRFQGLRDVLDKSFQLLLLPILSATINLLMAMSAAYPCSLFVFYSMSANGFDWPVLYTQLCIPLVYAAYTFTLVVVVVLHKWIVRGKTRAALDSIRGSVFAPLYLRLLGSRVHPTAYVDSLHVTEPDLLTIGKNAVVDHQATLMASTLEDRSLHMGRIQIQGGARLGVAATLLRDCYIGRDGELADASYLPPMQWVRPGSTRRGAGMKTDNADVEEEGLAGSNLITMAIKI